MPARHEGSKEKPSFRVPSGTPAPGFRDSGYRNATGGSGKLYYVGADGYSWSSTASGGNAHCLELYYARIIPQNLNLRANGFPLRCLQG